MRDERKMTFLEHLGELRSRLIVSACAVLVGSCIAFVFADRMLDLLIAPAGNISLRAFGLMDGFGLKLDIAVACGLAASFPVWAWQLVSFIGPALGGAGRRTLVLPILASMTLFAAGIIFGYSLLRPMIRVLVGIFPSKVEFFPSALEYISFTGFFLLACALAFELPCVLLLLVRMRILSSKSLRKQRRLAWFLLFGFAEVVTPISDPIVAPLVVMMPLVVLYEIAVLGARRIEARRAAAGATGVPASLDLPRG
jgi:sec-independent protein translocase protein TatC